jgi:hypothetical protein
MRIIVALLSRLGNLAYHAQTVLVPAAATISNHEYTKTVRSVPG